MSAPAGVVDGLLAGRYRLTSRLAAGAFGEVWRARDLLLDRDVAVKTLRPEIAEDADARERFRAEARSTGRLSHPGIAAVYDTGEDDGRAWLVLELVDGESLQSALRREGRFSADRTLDVVAQAAAALQVAHDRGVVHRDVKPGNLLLRTDGTVKVTDFGIASVAGSSRLTRTGELIGTAAYLSPEQAAGGAATAHSDLYALGVVAYECLAGAVPFAFDTPVAVLLAHARTPPPPLPSDVPAPVRELVDSLLAKDPQARPASAREVVRRAGLVREALASSASGPLVAPGPSSPSAPPTVTGAGVLAAAPAPDATSVLPATVPSTTGLPAVVLSAAPAPPVPVRPSLPARRTARAGLAGRLGQRRAVRLTALLLGLLAVALGVRGSSGDPAAPSPAPTPAATSPAAPTAPAPGPSDGSAPSDGTGAPAAPAPAPAAEQPAGEQDSASQQAPVQQPQQAPAQAPVQQPQQAPAADPGGGGPGAGTDSARDAADKAADKAEQAAEKARDAAEKAAEKGQDRPDSNGRGNAGGGNGGGNR